VTTGPAVHRQVAHVMGMPISLALRGRHARSAAGAAAWQAALAVLQATDRVFSTYRADSWVSRLDRDEVTLGDCPAEVAEVLALGERARVESGGAFDVRRAGPDGRVHLDPSGVVKGWAVDRAAAAFDRLDETDYVLSAGGDMTCRTVDPDAPEWRIGIEHPHDWTRVVAVVPVRNGAVATSGPSRRGAHIVDARTGLVPDALASVTVVGPSLTWADIDATAAFAMGADAASWLHGRVGGGLLVHADGTAETWVGRTAAPRSVVSG
jgi:thiamine biosynthesis lipoprotein